MKPSDMMRSDLGELMSSPKGRRGTGSSLRYFAAKRALKFHLIAFAKYTFYRYLNSNLDFDQIVDEWIAEHPNLFVVIDKGEE